MFPLTPLCRQNKFLRSRKCPQYPAHAEHGLNVNRIERLSGWLSLGMHIYQFECLCACSPSLSINRKESRRFRSEVPSLYQPWLPKKVARRISWMTFMNYEESHELC